MWEITRFGTVSVKWSKVLEFVANKFLAGENSHGCGLM